jgi:hypothetical protein
VNELARVLLDRDPDRPVRLVYGVATGTNTVAVRGAATAVVLPAILTVHAGDYCAVLESGADRVILGPVVTPASEWVSPTYQNGWVDYDTGGFNNVEYRKVGDEVQIRGIMKGGTPGTSPAFTLPPAFRPPGHLAFGSVADNAFAYFDVDATGEVRPQVGDTTWYSVICKFSTST